MREARATGEPKVTGDTVVARATWIYRSITILRGRIIRSKVTKVTWISAGGDTG